MENQDIPQISDVKVAHFSLHEASFGRRTQVWGFLFHSILSTILSRTAEIEANQDLGFGGYLLLLLPGLCDHLCNTDKCKEVSIRGCSRALLSVRGIEQLYKELILLSLTLQDHFKYSAYVRGEEMLVYHKISKEGTIYLNGSR